MTATTTIVFETHSTTEDNEAGIATGWLPGRLSTAGREQAARLGERRRDDGIGAIFCSDLARAVETVTIAFPGSSVPVLLDWRLRECDYGARNGTPRAGPVGDRAAHLHTPYAGGESWSQAVKRAGGFLDDLATSRWAGRRVLVVGHVATRLALDHRIAGRPLDRLVVEDFAWREGWEYAFGS